jgi:hypothetical protein
MGAHDRMFTVATAQTEGQRPPRAAMAGRIALLIVLGTMLAGCDKCGDWYWSLMHGEAQACRHQAPQPQPQ